jgi:hypothetical protein
MNTESLTTSSGSVDGQRSHAGIRNLLLDGLTLSSGAVDAISFLGMGKPSSCTKSSVGAAEAA